VVKTCGKYPFFNTNPVKGFELAMAKKSFKPSHLEQRHKTYYALLVVPKDVRPLIKKTKFFKSTQTSNLKQAELRAANWVFKWKQEIEKVRARMHEKYEVPHIASAMDLNQILRTSSEKFSVEEVIDEEAYRLKKIIGETDAEDFSRIAKGQRRYLKSIEAEWIKNEKSAGLEQKTIDQMAKDIKLITEHYATADYFNSKDIEHLLIHIGNSKGKSASSIKRITNAGRNFFRYLQKIGEITSDTPNPFIVPDDFRKSTKPNSRARFKAESWVPFKTEQVVFLFQIAMAKEDTPLANLIVIAAYTGARIEEICSLQRKHIDLMNLTISIIGAKTAAGNRTIPIHSAIQPLVEKLLEQSTDDYLISRLTKNKYGDRSNAIGKRFGRLKSAENFGKNHVFHSIRKTFVTMLENAGVSENVTADIVGHEKPRITYGLYSGGTAPSLMRESIEKISYSFPELT
jgi:integrase